MALVFSGDSRMMGLTFGVTVAFQLACFFCACV
jgi:hypothetical protein